MSFAQVYQHLLLRGTITPHDLRKIMAHQREHAPHAAHYAMRLGFIGAAQARQLRVAEAKLNIPPLRAALEIGLLTEEQVSQVAEAQASDAVRLGERLAALGLLSQDEFRAAMGEFMNKQVRFAEGAMQLPPKVPERGAILRTFEVTGDMFVHYWSMEVTGLGFDVRTTELPLSDHNAEVQFSGDLSMCFYIGVTRECVSAAGLELLGEPLTSDEEHDDIVREFANVCCGHALASFAEQAKRVQMQPPASVESPVALGTRSAVTLGLMTPFGSATLAMAY